ncbi:damage-inducible protein CinA [Secundilactobacillus pentosiphilus]|uniref:Putative competence-damage inducible protein n=1 Tax=Secundilactobacillus pentosiphilus TaxID=1714682 RepID=A0A1Z5IRZ2_9LACO|nr:competence/damage-inducible protein A [Secundilactobacillus pentosiphilus]GAX04352.1 damage-inducible protein CinA [Secundilactobacillus pentosiphilus]
MNAEIVAVGTELLLGQIANTNGAYLAQKLAEIGVNVYYQTVVGDNPDRLESVLKTAEKRSDLILTIGGLGPTEDDLTKQIVAHHLGEPLVIDNDAKAKIDQYGAKLSNNLKQALKIQNAISLTNHNGFAVGDLYLNQHGTSYVLLPGPPSECLMMIDRELMPQLKKLGNQNRVFKSRVLRFAGIGESQLVTDIADLIDHQDNPTIAPYAKLAEVTLRVTASAADEAAADALIQKTVDKILARDGRYFYGYGDDNSLAKVVVNQLIDRQLSVTAAESLTAGEFQSTIGSVPGVSAVFPGGFVTYANEAKQRLLEIPAEVIASHGVVSEATAIWMAKQAKLKMKTDIAVSFTGVAGPDELEDQPAGTVWIGIAYRDEDPQAYLYHFTNGRQQIRARSVLTGLDLIRQRLATN